MKIALCQTKIHDSLEKNLEEICSILRSHSADLYIFPELALTGYGEKLRELVKSEEYFNALQVLKEYAKDKKFLLGVPYLREEKLYNSALLFRDGNFRVVAEKASLFPNLDDTAGFSQGIKREAFSVGLASFYVFICFELRSTELIRRFALQGVDALIFIAQWPKARKDHWEALLPARAIENQTLVLGVNAIGSAFGTPLCGSTRAISYDGSIIAELKEDIDVIALDLSSFEPKLPYPRRVVFQEPQKILPLDKILSILEKRRRHGEKVVFTNGCFDILHAGHVDYLQKARALGDLLIVGLNSDASVKKIKGETRPINPQEQRAKVLASLSCVDYVIIFDEETPEELIKRIRPDILVKGADWEEDKIVGASFVKSYGGRVERIPFTYGISTTKIIAKLKEA